MDGENGLEMESYDWWNERDCRNGWRRLRTREAKEEAWSNWGENWGRRWWSLEREEPCGKCK